MSLRAGLPGVAALLLAACAAQAPRAPLPPLTGTPEANQQQREAVLAQQANWSLQGRVALSNGREGGSGRIDWQQDGARYDVSLSAPVTRQSWRITGDGSHARLEGIAGDPLEGGHVLARREDDQIAQQLDPVRRFRLERYGAELASVARQEIDAFEIVDDGLQHRGALDQLHLAARHGAAYHRPRVVAQ